MASFPSRVNRKNRSHLLDHQHRLENVLLEGVGRLGSQVVEFDLSPEEDGRGLRHGEDPPAEVVKEREDAVHARRLAATWSTRQNNFVDLKSVVSRGWSAKS